MMDAKIIDFAEYKRLHPPAVRLMAASVRCWWNWYLLPWGMMGRWWR